MRLELIVKLRFKATHTLEENERVHEHEWRVDTTLQGNPSEGRIISLPFAQNIFNSRLERIRNTHLNTNEVLDASSRAFPTCENLVHLLFREFSEALRLHVPENPSLKITSIEVGVSEDDGNEMGAARLTL